DAVFERYLTPTVVLTADAEATSKVERALDEVRKREGAASPISDIKRVEDFVPTAQNRKLEVMRNIKRLLHPKVIARLSADDRERVKDLLPEVEPKPVTVADLPDGIVANFRELDGAVGKLVHVYPQLPKGDKADVRDAKELVR